MEYSIRKAKIGDESILAYIQTESWKAGFDGILPSDVLEKCTQIDRVTGSRSIPSRTRFGAINKALYCN